MRKVSEMLNISTSTAHEYLTKMHKEGLLIKKEVGKTHLYSINIENVLARYMKIIISLAELNVSRIVDEIRKENSSVISIVLYGSTARGDDDEKSDFDILIISRKKEKIGGLRSQRSVKRIINLEQYMLSEWKRKASDDKIFYDKVIVDGIPLFGEIPIVI